MRAAPCFALGVQVLHLVALLWIDSDCRLWMNSRHGPRCQWHRLDRHQLWRLALAADQLDIDLKVLDDDQLLPVRQPSLCISAAA